MMILTKAAGRYVFDNSVEQCYGNVEMVNMVLSEVVAFTDTTTTLMATEETPMLEEL